MNWTNKGGGQGPWGSGSRPPGPNRPGGPGGPNSGGPKKPSDPIPPSFDDLLKRGQEAMRHLFGGSGRSMLLVILGILLLWLASGLYRVDATEQGVVLRFGQYDRTSDAGLHYHLPYPFEAVFKPNVTSINSVEIGYASPSATRPAGSTEGDMDESQMLTQDMNLVEINFEVQWRIKALEAEKFLFNVRDPELTVKPVAMSAMREVVGRMRLDDLLTSGQSDIANRTQEIVQRTLDSYDAGIEIVSVNLSKPDVPGDVINAFQDVKKAEQDKQTAINVAEQYRNEIMPKAAGEAAKLEQDSLAYKSQVVAKAQGETSRFLAVLAQYKLAPDVTRKRIYLETMEDVFTGMPKTIVDGKSGAVPYLPLPQLKAPANQGAK